MTENKQTMLNPYTELLLRLFDAAVSSVQASRCVPLDIPTSVNGKTVVIGAGKAAAAMAATVDDHIQRPLEGVVVVPYGHSVQMQNIRVIEAAHPIPDQQGLEGAQAVIDVARSAQHDDLVLVLLSGGGSALLAKPIDGVTFAEKQQVTSALVRSGASIHEINCVRRHLSAIKGGRLAQLITPAKCHVFAISDVTGDDPTTIASGPCSPDPTTQADARWILSRYNISCPQTVLDVLTNPQFETPKPDSSSRRSNNYQVIANSASMMNAVKPILANAGYRLVDLGEVVGESQEVAHAHAELAQAEMAGGRRVALVSRGETTVTHDGAGNGGPNREYALALALALQDPSNVHAIACDTDGIDGSNEVAGGWIDPQTLTRAQSRGVDARQLLHEHRSADFFEALQQEVITGPTRTNVNDFRCILVAP